MIKFKSVARPPANFTEKIESYLNEIAERESLDRAIIYKDSDGIWDGVNPIFNSNRSEVINIKFFPIQTENKLEAVEMGKRWYNNWKKMTI